VQLVKSGSTSRSRWEYGVDCLGLWFGLCYNGYTLSICPGHARDIRDMWWFLVIASLFIVHWLLVIVNWSLDMPLLIDGHNLIGRLPDLRLDDPDDEVKLVARLRAYRARTGKRVTVVFDRGLPGGHSQELSGAGVEVVFAAAGHTADGILRERIRWARDPRGLTVVTSDREVIAAARARGARVMRSEEFSARLSASGPDQVEQDVHLSPEEVDEWLRVFGWEDEAIR